MANHLHSNTDWYSWDDDTLIIKVYLIPRSAKDQIIGLHDGRLKIKITAPAIENQANLYLLNYIAKKFKVAKNAVAIISGQQSKNKTLTIKQPKMLDLIDEYSTRNH